MTTWYYNLTNVTESGSVGGLVHNLDSLSGGWLVSGFVVAVFVIVVMIMIRKGYEPLSVLLSASGE